MVNSVSQMGSQSVSQGQPKARSGSGSLERFLGELWFTTAAIVSFVLVVLTVVRDWLVTDPDSALNLVLLRFSLSSENNAAVLWSGMLLFVVGVHAFDGWRLHRQARPSLAVGWLSLALIMLVLSLDEIGSLHERVNLLVDGTWIELLPFALVLLGLFMHMTFAFWRHQDHRTPWLWILGAFLLFASVALQEYVEHRVSWPAHWKPIRTGVEEGTELVAALLLLRIAMRNSTRLFGGVNSPEPPALDATVHLRSHILLFSIIAIPALAAFTAALPDQGRGHPADWFTAAVFILAALLPVRYWILTRRMPAALIILAAGCCLGSLSTIVDPQNSAEILSVAVSKRLLALLVAATVALGMWWIINKHDRRSVAKTAVSLIGLFGLYFVSNESLGLSYLFPECIALAVFWAVSAQKQIRLPTL